MTTALALNKPQLTPSVWQMIQEIAPVMKDSRLFGVSTVEQAKAVMLKGHELGLSLTASFEFIHVIDNKPTLSPRGALALIQGSPLNDGIEIKHEKDSVGNPVACTVTMKRKGGMTYSARFSVEDAKRASLVKAGSGWEKYPGLMCQWRAVGYCADVVWSDLTNGLKRADEFGADLTPTGEVIEGTWSTSPTVSPKPTLTIQSLLATYTPQQIMAANDGKIPGTPEECQKVLDFISQATGTDLGLDVNFGGVLNNDK